MNYTGERLKRVVEESGISFVELAKRLGVKKQTVNGYFSHTPSTKTIQRVLAALEMEADEGMCNILEEGLPSYGKEDAELVSKSTFSAGISVLASLFDRGLLSEDEFKRSKDILFAEFNRVL